MPYTSADSDPGNSAGTAYDKGHAIDSLLCYFHYFIVDIDDSASVD